MALGNYLKRGGECDINQVAFKFTSNVCAVGGERDVQPPPSDKVLRCILHILSPLR